MSQRPDHQDDPIVGKKRSVNAVVTTSMDPATDNLVHLRPEIRQRVEEYRMAGNLQLRTEKPSDSAT